MRKRESIGLRQDMNSAGQAAVNAETNNPLTDIARSEGRSGVIEIGMCKEIEQSTRETSLSQQEAVSSGIG